MSTFFTDESRRNAFFQAQVLPAPTDTRVTYIDWSTDNLPAGIEHEFQRVGDLASTPPLRVIFAPLDLPGNEALRPLFTHYNIPTAFISERLHNVAYGGGSQICADGFHSSWFHYLCKKIDVGVVKPNPAFGPNSLSVVDPTNRANPREIRQSNWTWLRSSYFLRRTPASQQSATEASVTLICFGASQSLAERFRQLLNHSEWKVAVKDPYGLFMVVFGEIFKEMDQQAWNLADVFRGIEDTTLRNAMQTHKVSTQYDFVSLYNIAKYCTYLRESFNAILETMAEISSQHQPDQLTTAPSGYDATRSMFKHQKGLFKSTSLRLASLDVRIQSIINLSFNLVTQQDSRVTLQDNQTMKAIALITLLFLPIATVASFFGCQFFGLDSSASPPVFRASPQIWIFIVAVVVVMILMLPIWKMTQLDARTTIDPLTGMDAPMGNMKRSCWRSKMMQSARKADGRIELVRRA